MGIRRGRESGAAVRACGRSRERVGDVTPTRLSTEALDFLRQYITTAEQLDVLMTVAHRPSQDWNAVEVSNAIFSVPQSVELRFEELVDRQLIQRLSGSLRVRLAILPPAKQLALAEIHTAYKRSRAGIVNLIFQERADPVAKNFEDAFKYKP